MFKQYLEHIEGIAAYPVFSFTVFFVFFLAVSLYVFRGDKAHFDAMSRMPLNNNEPEHTNPEP